MHSRLFHTHTSSIPLLFPLPTFLLTLAITFSILPLLPLPTYTKLLSLFALLLCFILLSLPTKKTTSKPLLTALTCALLAFPPPKKPPTLPTPHSTTNLSILITQRPKASKHGWLIPSTLPQNNPPKLLLILPFHLAPKQFLLPGQTWLIHATFLPHQPSPLPKLSSYTQSHGILIAKQSPTLLQHPKSTLSNLKASLTLHTLQLEQHLLQLLSPQNAPFLIAMTLGNKHILPSSLSTPFHLTGTSHILAISGLHISALCLILWKLFSSLLSILSPHTASKYGKTRPLLPLVFLTLSLYVIGIGAPNSALRALSMLAVLFLSWLSLSRMPPIHILCTALSFLLLLSPDLILQPSFQLSATATLGILLYIQSSSSPQQSPNPSWLQNLARNCSISLSASLATLPIILSLSSEIPTSGFLANLLIVPIVSLLIFPLFLLGIPLSFLLPKLSFLLLTWAHEMMMQLHTALDFLSIQPGAVWRPGPIPAILIFTLLALILLTLSSKTHTERLVGLAFSFLLLLWPHAHKHTQPKNLHVHAIPVGQGDATLLQLPNQSNWLIDGGGSLFGKDPGFHAVLPYLRWHGIHSLDAVVLTHADLDHLDGLFAILTYATPKKLFVPHNHSDPRTQQLIHIARHKGTQIIPIHKSYSRHHDTISISILQPQLHSNSKNDHSLVVSIQYGTSHTLLTGDLEKHGERWLTQNMPPTPLTLLKIGHHGSKTSTHDFFLQHFSPKFAFVSCGKNNHYGHPHKNVLERLKKHTVPLARTDTNGAIHFEITPNEKLILHSRFPLSTQHNFTN